jgi:hypothetical protein
MRTPRNDQPGARVAVGLGVEVEPGVTVLVGVAEGEAVSEAAGVSVAAEVAMPVGVSVAWASGVWFGAVTVVPGVAEGPNGVKVGEGVVREVSGEEVNRTVLVVKEGSNVGELEGDRPAIAPAAGGEAVMAA